MDQLAEPLFRNIIGKLIIKIRNSALAWSFFDRFPSIYILMPGLITLTKVGGFLRDIRSGESHKKVTLIRNNYISSAGFILERIVRRVHCIIIVEIVGKKKRRLILPPFQEQI